jgi:hypothetical protein
VTKTGLLLCALTACSPAATPSVHIAAVHTDRVATEPPRRAAGPPARPTLASAGAKTCRVGEAVVLGPDAGGDAVLAFDESGGLAVWKDTPTSLALQPIALDGTKSGPAGTVAAPADAAPFRVRASDGRFVVLLRRWDSRRSEAIFSSLVSDPSGRVARRLAPANAPKVDAPTPRSDEIAFTVTNAAVPLPPSGGKIYEPMGRPVLERTLAGAPVGDPLRLEWNGNPIAYGFQIKDYVVFSGTHFLYPFSESDLGPTHDKYVQLLLPIDCRPGTTPGTMR